RQHAPVDRHEVAAAVVRREPGDPARLEEAPDAAVEDLLGREREGVVRDEGRAVRERERHAEEALAERHGAAAGEAAAARDAAGGGRLRGAVVAAERDEPSGGRPDAQHPAPAARTVPDGGQERPVDRQARRRRDARLNDALEGRPHARRSLALGTAGLKSRRAGDDAVALALRSARAAAAAAAGERIAS